jgi:hypothetical protein
MKRISYATRLAIAAASVLLFAVPAHATCTTSSPITAGIAIDAVTDIHNGGTWDGQYDLAGTADCPASPAFDPSDTLAVSAALSTPVWLGDSERFAFSGGLGISDSATAVGLNGVMRFDKNWSGFAGGAVSTDDTDLWAGKVGLRFGW